MRVEWDDARARAVLLGMFRAAVASADPDLVVAPHLPRPPAHGRCVVVGAGKSAARMAAAVEAAWPQVALSGVVVTRYGHAVPTRHIRVIEASHPVPDANGLHAAQSILEAVATLGPDDLVLALMSGGGSALLTLPAEGLTLADKMAVNQALLDSGAPIGRMNAVRKHLSAIKGGRLAAATRAQVVTLAMSDVPGDDPGVIASGPTVPDPTSFADALDVVAGLPIPDAARRHLEHGAAGRRPETPKPGSLPHAQVRVIATPAMALAAAASVASAAGLRPLILGDAIEGEAREAGRVLAGIARSVRGFGQPIAPPAVLLSGGETTVTIGPEGAGRGGRNTEFLLSLGLALHDARCAAGIWALAADTDGIDGTEDAAGALLSPDTIARAADPHGHLRRHDSYAVFDASGDLVRTGPTLTNVNDFRAILII